MRVALIVAMDRNRLIGRDNGLPWRLPEDLRHFKKVTMGHPLIMGRLTHESIGRPLPGRRNLVLSRDDRYHPVGCEAFPDLDTALAACDEATEVMVIGGGRIYELALPLASRLYLTWIDAAFEGDTWFPSIDEGEWSLVSTEPGVSQEGALRYQFRVYDRAPG